jgi:MFS transporter, DHA3 family, tetracycline resistance protein
VPARPPSRSIRSRIDPKHLYIGIEVAESFFVATAYTTSVVYRVISGHQNALQLILLGTVLELSYFIVQLPTGILADVVSRRLCVIAGRFLVAAGFLLQGVSPHFAVQLTAQIPVGFGAALTFGAQEAWLADESGETELTPVFLRATQLGLAGVIAGSILAGFLASAGLGVPFLVGGGMTGALAIALLFVMPEAGFRPARGTVSAGSVTRQAWTAFAGQARQTHRAIVVVPGLVLLLGMLFFLGMWNESFDRLWGAYLLKDIRFPHPFGLSTVMWFSVFAVAAALLGLGSTEWANRRTSKLGPGSVVTTLLGLTIATALGVAAMVASRAFVFAVIAYLAVVTMRPLFSPLVTGWVLGRVDSSVRATALSATDMFDSGGQIVGGPVIGVIGVLATIRVALLAGAAALAPAAALLVAATRRVRARADASGAADAAGHPGAADALGHPGAADAAGDPGTEDALGHPGAADGLGRPGAEPAPDVITPDLGQP